MKISTNMVITKMTLWSGRPSRSTRTCEENGLKKPKTAKTKKKTSKIKGIALW